MTRLMITRIWKWFLKEFIHIIPAVIFFFLAFNVINITVALLLKNEAVTYQNFPIILFSAAVVAKVILIADCLPLINAFPHKPLIYNVVWKSIVYGLISLWVRLIIRIFPFLLIPENISQKYSSFVADVNWYQFWAVQFWYFTLFLVFTAFKELIMIIGPTKVRRIFFGK
jgi:hypothetical protein